MSYVLYTILMQSIIVYTLYALSALVPLVFTTLNSELFEFPKFILLLSGTLIITLAWAIHIYKTRDFKIFKPSAMSYALLAILLTQALATIFSIHPYTSFWGYYSRFHQGLLTTICYTIIYFASLKWLDNKSTQKLIKISVITSFLIGLFAVAEHFGIDKKFWIQDVQNRVFSTLGQPNWLAAYVIPNFFLTLYLSQTDHHKSHSTIYHVLCAINFAALLFTKSRSGFLAFSFSYLTYWLLLARQFSFAKIKHSLLLTSIVLLLTSSVIGTPYTPPLSSLLLPTTSAGTALESGGTESGDIRKIVWTGAIKLIQRYPLLGTGPETFAYTYYWVRPLAHNLTSEWDFLYNKAHNEYLNIATGAGIIGLLAYLAWHFAIFSTSLTIIPHTKKVAQDQDDALRHLYPVLGACVVAFFITNFFGFSVIPVYLTIIFISILPTTIQNNSFSTIYHLPSTIYLFILLILLYPVRLFLADIYYAKGKATNSVDLLQKAISIRPRLDLYHSQLSEIYALVGQQDLALQEIALNKKLNPYHLNFYKSRAKAYLALNLNAEAARELETARELAPTDPKLAYNLGLLYTRLNDLPSAEVQLQTTISLKRDYEAPYYALTLLYKQNKQTDLIPDLLQSAQANLATYSSQLKAKIDQYLFD